MLIVFIILLNIACGEVFHYSGTAEIDNYYKFNMPYHNESYILSNYTFTGSSNNTYWVSLPFLYYCNTSCNLYLNDTFSGSDMNNLYLRSFAPISLNYTIDFTYSKLKYDLKETPSSKSHTQLILIILGSITLLLLILCCSYAIFYGKTIKGKS